MTRDSAVFEMNTTRRASVLSTAMRIAAVLLPLLLFAGQGANAQGVRRYADLQIYTMKRNGVERTFGLYVPRSYAKDRAAPLVVALHGRFSSAKGLHAISHLQAVADARGALLLYPEALGAFWDRAELSRGEPPADDPAFIGEAISAIMADYSVDRERVYLLGYDSGSAMAIRLACQSPVRSREFST